MNNITIFFGILLHCINILVTLTIIHAKDNTSPKKGTKCLAQKVHQKFSPFGPSKKTQGKSYSWVQMSSCGIGGKKNYAQILWSNISEAKREEQKS